MNGVWSVEEYNEDGLEDYTLYSTREQALKAAKQIIDYKDYYDDDELKALYLELEETNEVQEVVGIVNKMIH